MSEPKDWSRADLDTKATWMVIQGLTRGEPLQSLIGQAVNLAFNWKHARDEAEVAGEKPGITRRDPLSGLEVQVSVVEIGKALDAEGEKP